MPESDFLAAKLSLTFAKIVATPTPLSWSQVYNAGSLFAVLSLTVTDEQKENLVLPAIGKDIFSSLEAEFFTLQEKNLKSIQISIEKSLENLDGGIQTDAAIAYFTKNVLYLFIVGKGRIIMKRADKLGMLLDKKDEVPLILSASGLLEPGDTILLQTDHFRQNVSELNISEAFKLELPNDIAESLSPHVHEKEDGSQAAIIISYNGSAQTASSIQEQTPEPELKENDEQNPPSPPLLKGVGGISSFFKFKLPTIRLSRKQKISLFISLVIIILLIGGIIITKTGQENAKYKTLYTQVALLARKKYDEGKGLTGLNQSLASQDFAKAASIIKNNLDKFKNGSTEKMTLKSLLNKIEAQLNNASAPINKITPKIAEVKDNDLLSIEKSSHALSFAQDDSAIYELTSKAVTSIDKVSAKRKDIITNDNDWNAPTALSPYLGNIYILDRKSGVLKFVAGANGFGKTDYFKETPPDLTHASSLAIDGSVWILTQDGKILKYTKGVGEPFSITGLDKPLKNPTKIATDTDTDNLYILDNYNSRIVKLGKDGKYQNQYTAGILSQSKDFEIFEKDHKALVLSGNKIYELPL